MSKTVDKLNFFGKDSPFLSHPLLTVERTEKEVDFIIDALKLEPGMRILDVGCGFGRHSLMLAQRGFRVVGIDSSQAMIASARKHSSKGGDDLDLVFFCHTAETFVSDVRFDAAIALFTTLGQVSEEGENLKLVQTVYNALADGGRFLVEIPQLEVAIDDLKTNEYFGDEKAYTKIEREYDSHSQQMTERFEVKSAGGRKIFFLKYRLFQLWEVEDLLTGSEFLIMARYGNYDGGKLTSGSPIMLIEAQK